MIELHSTYLAYSTPRQSEDQPLHRRQRAQHNVHRPRQDHRNRRDRRSMGFLVALLNEGRCTHAVRSASHADTAGDVGSIAVAQGERGA